MEQPNILLIMVDQMAHDVMGHLGHPAAQTPNLDRLAAGGAVFTNAYCNSPLCVPSRASFMSGRLARDVAVYDNGSELPASVPTVAHHLARAGYKTILSGKMHFVGPDQHHGFDERLTGDISLPGLTLTPDWRRGAYVNEGSSVRRLTEPPVVDWNLQLAFDEEVRTATLNRLRKLRQEGDRFFLCASFSHPHDPFRITRKYWDRYQRLDVPPPTVAKTPRPVHPYIDWIQTHHEADRHPLDEEQMMAARRAYLGMVSYVDDLVGELLDELERLGMDDALVVFASDHGEMLGEHGMWFKRTYHDAASKVPLIVSWPNRTTPGHRDEIVSLVDLTATLLDVGEVPDKEAWIAEMAGDSFRHLLEGGADAPARELPDPETSARSSSRRLGEAVTRESDEPSLDAGSAAAEAAWKDSAVCEYLAEGTVTPMLFLRKGRHKFVYVHGHEPLLFDLEADPQELRNLASEPEHAELRVSLQRELLDGLDVAELERRILRSQRERLAIDEVMDDHLAWALRPRRDALRLYGRSRR